jgi:hypothetical protein
LWNSLISNSQSPGDIAFIAFNTNGDKDFAIAALANINPNSTLYFTDNETDGNGNFTSGEGVITWSSGAKTITAGTIVIFTDTKNYTNLNFGASIGSISRSGSFNLSSFKEGIIAYTGNDANTPSTYLAAIQIGNDSSELGPFDPDEITLTATRLSIGTTITVINNVASPNGGKYAESRSDKNLFSNYLTSISDKTKWTTTASFGNGEALLPFSEEAFTIQDTNWTGSTSNVWNLAGNWDNGVPTSSSLVTILNVVRKPIINSSTLAEVGNLTIDAGTLLTINSANALTINGTLEINGELVANSGSSLIIKGTAAGKMNYKRSLETTNWYLVSSPVHGEIMTDVRANNSFDTNSQNKISFAPYDNSQALDKWAYFENTATDALVDGKGYSTKLAAINAISFMGNINTSDISIALTQGADNGGDNFNLLGNPFTSFINSSAFLTSHTAAFTQEEIYIWNQASESYETKVSGVSFKVAPAQGFFIEANSTNNVTFSEEIQSHEASDTFQKTSRFKIKLLINDNTSSRYADIYYIENTTTGFDNGYDGKLFGGISHPFALYTHLVSNSKGDDFQIQSLPNSDYQTMIIPVGVNAESEKELTFSTETINLPSGIKVYLEDRFTNTFTRLDEKKSEYTINLAHALNGVGRFYLHTSESVLSIKRPLTLTHINIYKTNNFNLKITGLQKEKATISIFSVLGKNIMNTTFEDLSVKNILLPKLSSGIYIVRIQTKKGSLNKKIILE